MSASMGEVNDPRATSGRDNTPRGRRAGRRALAGLREMVIVLVLALVFSFVVKSWFVQAFYIPSGSMENTLLVGDRVIVNKLSPRFTPLTRGDVIVFEDPGGWLPPQPPTDQGPVLDLLHRALVSIGLAPTSEDHLIKRLIGLPGDHVVCCSADQKLLVNGVEIEESGYLKPGDVPSSVPFDIVVPPGKVWVMGDHRSDSEDSRFHDPNGDGKGGSVALELVTGRAMVRVWPVARIGGLAAGAAAFQSVPQPAGGGASTP